MSAKLKDITGMGALALMVSGALPALAEALVEGVDRLVPPDALLAALVAALLAFAVWCLRLLRGLPAGDAR